MAYRQPKTKSFILAKPFDFWLFVRQNFNMNLFKYCESTQLCAQVCVCVNNGGAAVNGGPY